MIISAEVVHAALPGLEGYVPHLGQPNRSLAFEALSGYRGR